MRKIGKGRRDTPAQAQQGDGAKWENESYGAADLHGSGRNLTYTWRIPAEKQRKSARIEFRKRMPETRGDSAVDVAFADDVIRLHGERSQNFGPF